MITDTCPGERGRRRSGCQGGRGGRPSLGGSACGRQGRRGSAVDHRGGSPRSSVSSSRTLQRRIRPRDLNRSVDIPRRGNTNRTARPLQYLDVLREEPAQPVLGDRRFVRPADVDDLHQTVGGEPGDRAGEGGSADRVGQGERIIHPDSLSASKR